MCCYMRKAGAKYIKKSMFHNLKYEHAKMAKYLLIEEI